MNLTFVFWITALYTVVLFSLQIYELLSGQLLFNFAALNAAYLALLSAYVGGKEVTRWVKSAELAAPEQSWRPRGEWFVGLWAISLPVVTLLIQFWPGRFHYPQGLNTIALEVLGFYLGSNVSRWLKTRGDETHTGLEQELAGEAVGKPSASEPNRWISKKRQRYEAAIVEKVRKQGSITREEVEKLTRLKDSAAGTLLNGMVDRNVLKRAGGVGINQTRYELA